MPSRAKSWTRRIGGTKPRDRNQLHAHSLERGSPQTAAHIAIPLLT
jgi:hypothetical protein